MRVAAVFAYFCAAIIACQCTYLGLDLSEVEQKILEEASWPVRILLLKEYFAVKHSRRDGFKELLEAFKHENKEKYQINDKFARSILSLLYKIERNRRLRGSIERMKRKEAPSKYVVVLMGS